MKIAWLTHRDILNPRAGGAEIAVHRLSLEQMAQGHEVEWFTSKFPGAKDSEQIDGIKVHRVSSEKLLNWYLLLFRRREISEFNIVIESLCKVPFFWPAQPGQKRLAYTTHLFGTAIFAETNPLVGTYVYALEKLIPRFYQDHFFAAISPSTKDDLIERGIATEKIVVAPCGITLEHAPPHLDSPPRESTPLLVHVGRLKKYKGLEFPLRALSILAPKYPELKLVILGGGDDRPRLESEVKRLRLDKNVVFKGFVSEQEKIQWLQRAWAILYPSIKEGQGLSILEAAAFQTPTISSHSPGLRDFIQHQKTGLLVKHNEPDQWAAAIESLLNSPQRAEEMGKNSKDFCQQFSWKNSSKSIMDMLESNPA